MTGLESAPSSQGVVCETDPLSVLVVEEETVDFDALVRVLQRSGINARYAARR